MNLQDNELLDYFSYYLTLQVLKVLIEFAHVILIDKMNSY